MTPENSRARGSLGRHDKRAALRQSPDGSRLGPIGSRLLRRCDFAFLLAMLCAPLDGPFAVSAAPSERPPLRLAIEGLAEDVAAAVFVRLRDVVSAAPPAAELTWDDSRGVIRQPDGAVVGRPASLHDVQGTVDKWLLLEGLSDYAEEHPLPIDVVPPEDPHAAGSSLRITVPETPRPFLVVFVLSGTGELALLFPEQGQDLQSRLGRPFIVDTVVTPPFGADHIIALATDTPTPELLGLLQVLDGHGAGVEVGAALARAVGSVPYDLGIAAIYTTP